MIPAPRNEDTVYGYYGAREKDCQAYDEYLRWDQTSSHAACKECQNYGYCTGSDEECENFLNAISEGIPISKNMPANKGLVNWVSGPIVSIMTGDYMALVSIQNGENLLTSMLPRSEFETLGYKEGDIITMAVKAVNVKILK